MNELQVYILESGVCLALFYSIYWLFLKRETFFAVNRLFLILSLPLSFMIPLLNIPSPFVKIYPVTNTYPLTESVGTSTASVGFVDIAWFVFLAGAGFFLVRFLFQLIQLFLLIRKHGYYKLNGAKIVLIDNDSAPFSFINFIFINKSDISENDLQRILEHELIHIKQYHTFDLILLELVTIVQWFNPFVWPYKKSLKETHEYLADNAVIAQGCSKAKYQLLIFEQHVGLKLSEIVNNFNRSLIKRRITMMTKIKSRGRAKFKLLLILPVIALLVLVFAEPQPAKSPEASGKSVVDNAVISEPDTTNDKADDEKKKAEELAKQKEMVKMKKELMAKEKALKMELEKTEDQEKKKELKQKLTKLYEYMKVLEENYRVETAKKKKAYEEMLKKEDELKKMYKATDDAKKKNQIKEKLAQIQAMKAEMKNPKKKETFVMTEPVKVVVKDNDGNKKAIKVMIDEEWFAKKKELKKLIAETDDPEKKAKLKEKYEQMQKIEAMVAAKMKEKQKAEKKKK